MRRVAAVTLLLLGVAVAATTSRAQISPPVTVTVVNGQCFLPPYNTLTPCPTSPTPTPAPITPTKTLDLGGPVPGPNGTTSYSVTVTSRFLCFSVQEPVILYTIGSPGAAALTPLTAASVTVSNGSVSIMVDPGTGTATLLLEVFNKAVGPEGLVLKAVWPQEGIERLVTVIAPRPTATPTLLPGQLPPAATPTPTPSPTPSATPTPTASGATSGAATPTPTATPTTVFTVRVCVDPNPVPRGGSATVTGLTAPGAICAASVGYNDNTVPSSTAFPGGNVTAGSDGVVQFPLTVESSVTATGGTASINCLLNGVIETGKTTFTIT
ncbi:MAG: hypothetical protein JOZ41_22570 [Chloroflexi bacterium]|nr:hypothetical protein [Chloroflexota bacterium]